jgi:hypothetical protein
VSYGFNANATTCSTSCRQRAYRKRNGAGTVERRLNYMASQEMRRLNRRDPGWRKRIPNGQSMNDGSAHAYQDAHFYVPDRFVERCAGCGAYGDAPCACPPTTWAWSLGVFVKLEPHAPPRLLLPSFDGWISLRREKHGPQQVATGDIEELGQCITKPKPADVSWQSCRIQIGESQDLDVGYATEPWWLTSHQRAARGSRNRWERSDEPWVMPEDDASLLLEIENYKQLNLEAARARRADRVTRKVKRIEQSLSTHDHSRSEVDHKPVHDPRRHAPTLRRAARRGRGR